MQLLRLCSDAGNLVAIWQGDNREVLAAMPAESVDCIVTSPPYWGLRDYGVAGQIGLEASVPDYARTLVSVFAEARRVLKSDGTLWLNLGDAYSGSGKGGNPGRSRYVKQNRNAGSLLARDNRRDGIRQKELLGLPWRSRCKTTDGYCDRKSCGTSLTRCRNPCGIARRARTRKFLCSQKADVTFSTPMRFVSLWRRRPGRVCRKADMQSKSGHSAHTLAPAAWIGL